MSNATYILAKPTTWSSSIQYSPNAANYPIVILPQVIYSNTVYTYTGKSTIATIPSSDANATATYSSSSVTTQTYLLLAGLAVSSVASGAQSLATVTGTAKSSNITVNTSNISVPLNSVMNVQLVLNATTSSASGATFTIAGTYCTVVSQSIAVGASITAGQYIVNAIVTTTSTASPVVSINAASVTGTVAINSTSSLILFNN